jgi:hypothetical protein
VLNFTAITEARSCACSLTVDHAARASGARTRAAWAGSLSLLFAFAAAAAPVDPPLREDGDARPEARPPVINAVVDYGDYTGDPDTLTASWVASGTNITQYKYGIGTSAGATNVVPWTSVGLNTSVTRNGLSLSNETTYYFTVRAYNDVGDEATGNSDGITADFGYPTLGPVVDEGAYTASPSKLSFSFSGSDAESGIKEYQYAIGTGTDIEALVPWTSSGLVTERTVSGLNLVEGETYYIAVYAVDNAAHVTMGTSDGIQLDVKPPAMGYVTDAGAVTTNATELSATWGAVDPMGVAGYRYSIGTTPGGADVVAARDVGLTTSLTTTGLSLQTGRTYYVTVTATDVSGRSATAVSDGIRLDDGSPFAIDDTRVGDSKACYTNPEVSDDGRYMIWAEHIAKLNDAGEGIVHMWHCAIDPETGGFIPFDCRGFNGFDSTTWGRAYMGRDRNGVFYLGANENYQLTMTRITGSNTGTTTVIGSLADPERRAIYPSVISNSSKIYAYWLKSHGTTLAPQDAEWVELRYVDIANPTNEIVVEHQDNTPGDVVPLDVTFPRWAFNKPLLIYGRPDSDDTVNIFQVDASRQPPAPVQLTDDPHVKSGPYPIVFGDKRYIVTAVDGTTESYVYEQPNGNGMYEVVESFMPPANKTFRDACGSNSHQPFIMNGKLYTSYGITNCQGDGDPNMFNFLSYPGQIWFKELLNDSAEPTRISTSNTYVRNEPEPAIGAANANAWIYYSSYPSGTDPTTACPQLRRSTTPIGLGGS